MRKSAGEFAPGAAVCSLVLAVLLAMAFPASADPQRGLLQFDNADATFEIPGPYQGTIYSLNIHLIKGARIYQGGPAPALEIYAWFRVNRVDTGETLQEFFGGAALTPDQAGIIPYSSAWLDNATVEVWSEDGSSNEFTFHNVTWQAAQVPPSTTVFLDGVPVQDLKFALEHRTGQPTEIIVRRGVPATCTIDLIQDHSGQLNIYTTDLVEAIMGDAVELTR
jgi:hypothetical protein